MVPMDQVQRQRQKTKEKISAVGHEGRKAVTGNYNQLSISLVFASVIRSLQKINPIFFVVLIILATYEHASAQYTYGPVEQSCAYKRTYAVLVKLLVVYASHVVTIRLEPGLNAYQIVASYVVAALLPAATTTVAVCDLWYEKRGFGELPGDHMPNPRCYRSMQQAINAGAACLRLKKTQVENRMGALDASQKVRGKPLDGDDSEIFVCIPRGTSATRFEPVLIIGNWDILKAVVGVVQLAFATLQLISSTNPRVAAYGLGSYIYTVIPYATSSIINVVCAIFISSYSDITEMELLSNPEGAEQDFSFLVEPKDHMKKPLARSTSIQLFIYIAIFSARTRYRAGISSFSQRFLFLSWAIFGISFGHSGSVDVDDQSRRHWLDFSPRRTNLVLKSPTWFRKMPIILVTALASVFAVGGVVVMVQQYVLLVEC